MVFIPHMESNFACSVRTTFQLDTVGYVIINPFAMTFWHYCRTQISMGVGQFGGSAILLVFPHILYIRPNYHLSIYHHIEYPNDNPSVMQGYLRMYIIIEPMP